MNIKSAKVLIYDIGGIFPEQALRLLRDCAAVKYYSEWRDAFPEMTRAKIGYGFDGIERVSNFEDHKSWADFIFVPDTMCASLVNDLRREGYAVAGAGSAEWLELERWETRQFQTQVGLAKQPTKQIVGVTALEKFLRENENWYIKIDSFRGTLESFKHTNWRSSEQEVDNVRMKAGPFKEDLIFICEKIMKGIEPGLDGITFDGDLLFPTLCGFERKGVGIIERRYDLASELPAALREINDGLAVEFKNAKTKFFFSAEFIMDKDRVPYLIDPTIRLAAPGTSAIQSEMITNYSQVVYGLATGKKVDPIMKWKYGVAIAGNSDKAEKRWLNVSFPRSMRDFIKFRMAVKKGGGYYAVPGFTSICTVLGFGNTIDAAITEATERSKEVQASGLKFDTDGILRIKEDIAEAKKLGIDF